jgi:hypothetical protein
MSHRLRTRLSRLEARFGVPPVYPVAALFAADGVLLHLDMSDGLRLSGPDAALGLWRTVSAVPPEGLRGFRSGYADSTTGLIKRTDRRAMRNGPGGPSTERPGGQS